MLPILAMRKRKLNIAFAAFVAVLLTLFCIVCTKQDKGEYDFAQITESDTLRIITLNTSTSYFIYRDQPMGFHYDMISSFCKYHGLTPEIIVAENSKSMIQMLEDGSGDVIAYNIPVTNELRSMVLFCGFEDITHQVLVQQVMMADSMVVDVTGLIGKTITLVEGSKHYDRMVNLNNELGGGIIIESAGGDSIVAEDLIRMVSRGDIGFTIADDDLAKFNQTYFSNIDVHLPVSFDQRSSWAVRKDTPVFADSLNSWFEKNLAEPAHVRIVKRYFEETKGYSLDYGLRMDSLLGPGVISQYDVYFRKNGEITNIDWRLLASVAYQESSFMSEGVSWAGAIGVMGLMPRTAISLGAEVDDLNDPEINIRAGSQYLKSLINIFSSSISDRGERVKMALAAYNGGIGHISDARALAEKYGADKNVWSGNVEKYIQLKRLEQYYNDPVCKNGYFRGDETVNYVRDVISRWELYRDKTEE